MSHTNREKPRVILYLAIFILVMFIGVAGFMRVEHLSLWDAAYFTIVTIATVGFGDISPVTEIGKLLTVLLIVAGVGTFVGLLANATEMFLNRREKAVRRQKLQMIVGLFFSEAGTRLMRFFAEADRAYDFLAEVLTVQNNWRDREYRRARKKLEDHAFEVDMQRVDLHALKAMLDGQSDLLVRLLESPYMLEHESFTDLIIEPMPISFGNSSTTSITFRAATLFSFHWPCAPIPSIAMPPPLFYSHLLTLAVLPKPWKERLDFINPPGNPCSGGFV
jgi:voltage-gated potassium channel